MAVALVVAVFFAGFLQRLGAAKQQQVRHIFAALGRHIHLRQIATVPTQQIQQRMNQGVLGLGFVQHRISAQVLGELRECLLKVGKDFVIQVLVGRRVAYAVQQKVLGEKLALHGVAV